jgi:signal transduction histidine kinase
MMNMNRNSIRWRLPASYAVVALLAALSLGSVMLLVLREYYANQEREYLFGNATALQPIITEILQSHSLNVSLQDQIKGLSFLSRTQIRLLDVNGNALADSGIPDSKQVVAMAAGVPVAGNVIFSMPVNPPADKEPLFIYGTEESSPFPQTVPFEKQILPGKSGDIILSVNASPYGYGFVARNDSDTRRRSSESVSLLLFGSDGKKLGILEFSNGPSYGTDVIRSVTGAWFVASVFAIVIAALAGWFMSKRVTGPVLALEQATRQMEQGDLKTRVHLPHERQQEFLSLANSFNGMAAQVEQTVATLREFVADAAHELHTPLTALQANIELARNEKNASTRSRYLSRAHGQGQRLEALVQSLLDLSRIEAAAARASFTLVDYSQLVREVGEQFASRAEQADRSFTLNISEGAMQVIGNETQLRQVVINLLENAFKFTPQEGSISVDLARSENEARLTIRDTGIGIPPEDLTHLFERFHRGRNAAEYAGNGLGLAIVKAIVTRHAGNVTIDSQSGQGTKVNVSIPLASATDH